MGLDGCRMYCVEWNVLKARPFRKSLGCSRPATGRICHPVSRFRIWDKSSSWGTCMPSHVALCAVLAATGPQYPRAVHWLHAGALIACLTPACSMHYRPSESSDELYAAVSRWVIAHLVLTEVEERQAAQELCAGMLVVQVPQLSEDWRAHVQLVCVVQKSRNGLAHTVGTSQVTNVPPPVLVCLVSVPRMVLCQVCSKPHDLTIVNFLQALGKVSFGEFLRLPFRFNLCNACEGV